VLSKLVGVHKDGDHLQQQHTHHTVYATLFTSCTTMHTDSLNTHRRAAAVAMRNTPN
jgi:hypothetical protein